MFDKPVRNFLTLEEVSKLNTSGTFDLGTHKGYTSPYTTHTHPNSHTQTICQVVRNAHKQTMHRCCPEVRAIGSSNQEGKHRAGTTTQHSGRYYYAYSMIILILNAVSLVNYQIVVEE
jgi:hypothetical protein